MMRDVKAGMLVLALAAAFVAGPVLAADPPRPDFFWPYGRVTVDGVNAEPSVQTVIALVDGKACGEATTRVAVEGVGVPTGDIGATVYVVDVLADGAGAGQRTGCGRAGATVMLYFAGSRRIAMQEPAFVAGGQRVDVELGPELAFRVTGPMVAGE